MHERHIQVVRLGRTAYARCWALQEHLLSARIAGSAPDTLLLTEHDPVYTIGRAGDDNHLLASDTERAARGVELFHNDRGGDITYHGPGQLVGYPILNLDAYYRNLHRFLRDLEEVAIRTLHTFGIEGTRLPGYTGVWVNGEKICAIGIKTRQWCTMHGFALNVSTDLSFFDRIIPCGIFERGVTSMQRLMPAAPPLAEVETELSARFGDVFGAAMSECADLAGAGAGNVTLT